MSTLGRLLAACGLLLVVTGCGAGPTEATARPSPATSSPATSGPATASPPAPSDHSPSDPSDPHPSDPGSSDFADARGPAAAYVAFAESGAPGRDVPWSATVQYSIAGEQVATLSRDFAERRESWARCPGGVATYEGRDCPVSPLATLWRGHRDGEEPTYETDRPETVGCSRYESQWDGLPIVWIRPAVEHRDCFSDYAIAVAVEDGEIVAVDLVLSGP